MYLEKALDITFGHEGVWSNHPLDPGKETIFGVSRRWQPTLDLWKYVDKWDKRGNPPQEILDSVISFYRGKIWEPFKVEEIAKICPELAYAFFDTTVHLWVDQSIPFLQQTINYLRKGELEPIDVDGWIGNETLRALRLLKSKQKLLVNIFGIIRGSWYLDERRWNGKQDGFINRITFL